MSASYLGRGAEHEVHHDSRRKRVVKVTRKSTGASFGFGISLNHDGQGATAKEYLDRLRLHNAVFNDDVRLEKVVPGIGTTRVVTSQPYVAGEPATPLQVDAYMSSKGFQKLGPGAFYNRDTGLLIHDLFPRNVMVSSQRRVCVIDPAIIRATPQMAQDYARALRATGNPISEGQQSSASVKI